MLSGPIKRALEGLGQGQVVTVDGAAGCGLTSFVETLMGMMPTAIFLEALPRRESDASAVLMLELEQCATHRLGTHETTASAKELAEHAEALGATLRGQHRPIVLRLPSDWGKSPCAPPWLTGLLRSRVPLVVVSDSSIHAAADTLAHVRIHLPRVLRRFRDLEPAAFGTFSWSVEALASSRFGTTKALPLALHLAIGAKAVGVEVSNIGLALESLSPIRALVTELADQLSKQSDLSCSVARFLCLRRPVPRDHVQRVTGIRDGKVPLLTDCLAFGSRMTRVASVLRDELAPATAEALSPTSEDHRAAALYYSRLTPELPRSLTRPELQAWCELEHHTARSTGKIDRDIQLASNLAGQ